MILFITATDTDVGKTYVAKGLANEFHQMGKKVAYFKPFQSGVIDAVPTDADTVKTTGVTVKNSYVTKFPGSPKLSAELENVEINVKKILDDLNELKKENEIVIIEGSGGVLVPVTKNILMIDIIKEINTPTLVVARPNLGTINHTLLTINALEAAGAKLLGVVISNMPKNTEDKNMLGAKAAIEEFSDTRVLATIYENQTNFKELAKTILDSQGKP